MPKAKTPTELIDAAFSKRLEIALHLAALEKLNEQIIALGAGKHSGSDPDRPVTVVSAQDAKPGAVYYELPEGGEAKAREHAGVSFGTVFTRLVSYVPIEGFEHVVPTHLTPARSRDLLALCHAQRKETPGKRAYVLYPKEK